jgi:hypothetical protein
MFVLHPDGAILLLKTIETENGTNWICTLLKLTTCLNYLQAEICLLTGTESSCALHIIMPANVLQASVENQKMGPYY